MWIIFKALSLDENLKVVSTDRNKNPCHGPSALECQEVREMRRDHQRRMGGSSPREKKARHCGILEATRICFKEGNNQLCQMLLIVCISWGMTVDCCIEQRGNLWP